MKEEQGKRVIRCSFIFILLIMIVLTLQKVACLQGTARVINYAGILRGATQRLVKLELADETSEALLQRIDVIFYGLRYGSEEEQLIQVKDTVFQTHLKNWEKNWNILKQKINEGDKNDFIEISEENFQLADITVNEAECYTEHLVKEIQVISGVMILDMIGIVCMFIYESIKQRKLSYSNVELRKKAYLDLHTGLRNKSSCNEVFTDQEQVKKDTACIMCDLNDLKQVNDTLGHMEGDTLIIQFANILKEIIPEGNFIGRYGGDEFVILLEMIKEEDVKDLLSKLQKRVDRMGVSVAYGYAGCWDKEGCSKKELLDEADRNMYLKKREMKTKE